MNALDISREYVDSLETQLAKVEDELATVRAQRDELLASCQMAYRKHHMGDDRIGWEELSRQLLVTLDNVMGANERVEWSKKIMEEIP